MLPFSRQPEKVYPLDAEAVTVTWAPASTLPPPLAVPPPWGSTDSVTVYRTGSGGGTVAGVTRFNGRQGAVLPQSGDYTAAMVGAIPASQVQAVQALTQAEYDALGTKSASTLYLIKE